MATRTVTTLVDDLDGSTAEESIAFGLDRVDYEIDLSTDHAEDLRDVLAPYISAGRRTGGRRTGRGGQPSGSSSSSGEASAARSRATNAQIRAWAAEHGVALAERGRLPGKVIEAFEAGDPTRLPGTADHADTAAEPPADVSSTSESTSSSNEPARGRDGLTAAEREAIRAWAVEQGIEVKSRGQLKKDLIANYQAWQSRQG